LIKELYFSLFGMTSETPAAPEKNHC